LKILIKYISDFLKADFKTISYLPVFIYTATCLSINYTFDFEHKILDNYVGTFIGLIYYFLFYSIAYFPVAIYVLTINKKSDVLKSNSFWFYSLFIMLLLAG